MSQILERYRLIAMISPLLLLAACSHARTLPIHLAWMYRPISQMKREVKASWTNRPAVLFPSIGGRPTAIRTSMPWSGRRWSAIPN